MENSAHCDFVKLRNMLVRAHMQDLKDVTRETHYENYRAQSIQRMERNRKYARTEAQDTHTHSGFSMYLMVKGSFCSIIILTDTFRYLVVVY